MVAGPGREPRDHGGSPSGNRCHDDRSHGGNRCHDDRSHGGTTDRPRPRSPDDHDRRVPNRRVPAPAALSGSVRPWHRHPPTGWYRATADLLPRRQGRLREDRDAAASSPAGSAVRATGSGDGSGRGRPSGLRHHRSRRRRGGRPDRRRAPADLLGHRLSPQRHRTPDPPVVGGRPTRSRPQRPGHRDRRRPGPPGRGRRDRPGLRHVGVRGPGPDTGRRRADHPTARHPPSPVHRRPGLAPGPGHHQRHRLSRRHHRHGGRRRCPARGANPERARPAPLSRPRRPGRRPHHRRTTARPPPRRPPRDLHASARGHGRDLGLPHRSRHAHRQDLSRPPHPHSSRRRPHP